MVRLLYIDENPEIYDVVKEVVQVYGYEVDCISDITGDLIAGIDDYSLIIIDWYIGYGAEKLYSDLLSKRYKGKIMITSSRNIGNNQRLRLDQLKIKFLGKPFSVVELADAIEKAIK